MSKSIRLIIFFYNIFLRIYRFAISIASLSHEKARKWVVGRRDILEKIEAATGADPSFANSTRIWFHCASLGEFEQGKPVIEQLRQTHPGLKVIVTFFSPSGYEIKMNDPTLDFVFYLPLDSKTNARIFIQLISPALAVFVKYDLWFYYLRELHKCQIPVLLISSVFREKQGFFKWYGSLQRKMLKCLSYIFTQDEISRNLLVQIGFRNVSVAGDTRFDTVAKTADSVHSITLFEEYLGSRKCIVAGSTWPKDEELLSEVKDRLVAHNIALIIAPHEINNSHMAALETLFPSAAKFSDLRQTGAGADRQVLIIDNIGMLAHLYQYASITYIGGGFTKDGVHNVLEAAVYGKPVLFGSNYNKYREAIELIAIGGAKPVATPTELIKMITFLIEDTLLSKQMGNASKNYVLEHVGATNRICAYIEENRLLTR